uniref:START domain-containing protein n=1 Tax=Tanacetum cinerariifolium TaxID=118510 RepID=A0A699HY74_TANCI|nr:START domain-containing protein [Tanacetum cinerariifolium]GEY98766.1 START domain-containing protein [Tanacetum cinerariifolium]
MFLKNLVVNGPYVMRMIEDASSMVEKPKMRLQTKDDLTSDEMKKLRRLMHDTNLSEQEMISRFMNEFDKFTSKFAALQCTQADLLARQLRNSAGSTKRGDEQHGEIRKEEMESGLGSDIHHTRAKKYESVMAGVKELRELFKDGLWIKSSGGGGGDVLDEHKYQQAFLRSSNQNHRPWTTKA